jgi:excinuclease ABC subunit C
MLDASGGVLYVGKAKNLKKRVSSYFKKTGHSPRIALMLQQVAAHGGDGDALRSRGADPGKHADQEAGAEIQHPVSRRQVLPLHRIVGRRPFRALFYHRGSFEKKSHYFGPFPNGLAVRESIQLIQKTFLLRTCEECGVRASLAALPDAPDQALQGALRRAGLAADYAADVRLANSSCAANIPRSSTI